jgi:Zn-finger nucleic acid-binding protein
MVRTGATGRFWFVLAGINLLAVSYPILLFRLASNTDASAHLGAAFVLIGCVLLLAIVDVVSIAIADDVKGICLNSSGSSHKRSKPAKYQELNMATESVVVIKLELKYCESCGGLWLRKAGDHLLFCRRCRNSGADLSELTMRTKSMERVDR